VLLVQLRELRNVSPAKGSVAAPDPYLKLTLSGCSQAEKWSVVGGKQSKQSQVHGKCVCFFSPFFLCRARHQTSCRVDDKHLPKNNKKRPTQAFSLFLFLFNFV
jgi:hypothetical protein